MKATCLYVMLGLSMVVAQTTLFRLPLFQGMVSDLLIPLIVFQSLSRPNRSGITVTVTLGLVMDLISGGIFGLYLSIYFWVFLSARGLSRYFDAGETLFQAILIGLYVLGQHLVFFAAVPPSWGGAQLLASRMMNPILLQTVFGAVTGPGVLMLLRRLQTRVEVFSPVSRNNSGELGNP
jgi:rod shape-determining protein MreD